MRTLKRTLMILAAVLAASASAGTQTWSFSDGFNENDEWLLSGSWEAKDGFIQCVAGSQGKAFVGEDHWDNYIVEAKVRIDKPPPLFGPDIWAGVVFRSQVRSLRHLKCYAFSVDLLLNRVMLGQIIAEGDRSSSEWFGARMKNGVQLKRDKWFTLRAHVEGGGFQLYINGIFQFQGDLAVFQGGDLATGRIGFYSNAPASFDNLTVTGENIEDREDRLSVQPNGKLAAQWAQLKHD